MAVGALPTFPTVADVVADLQGKVTELNSLLTNFNPGGVTQTYLDAAALGLGSDASTYPGALQKGAYELLAIVQAGAFILTASGTYLDAKAADVGVFRKDASAAVGPGVWSLATPVGTDTVIPIGSVVQAESADPTQLPKLYKTTTTGLIPAGQLVSNTTSITCTTTGPSGDQIPGAVNIVVSAPGGLSFINTDSVSGGSDTEQDDEPNGGLRARALAAIPNAGECTIAAIEDDALKFGSIVYSLLLENTADDGLTFLLGRGQLYVDDGSGDLSNVLNPNHGIIAAIQAAFNTGLYRAAGTQIHVVGSSLLHTSIYLFVQVNADYAALQESEPAVRAAVAEAVMVYVNALGIGTPVLISEIVRVAAEVPGVSNVIVSSVAINGNNIDMQPGPTQAARIILSAGDAVTVDSSQVPFYVPIIPDQPETQLTEYFGERPYNFDRPPPPYLIGPIKTLLTAVGQRLVQLQADITNLGAMVSVQNAAGIYLDLHGVLYGVGRNPGELDNPYRARILLALKNLGLTIPNLTVIANAFMQQLHPANPPVVYIYDLQSDPTRCIIDAGNGFNVEILQFVVETTTTVREDEIAFLDYTAFLDRTCYVFRLGTLYGIGNGELLALMNRKKAANTQPIMKSNVSVTLDHQAQLPAHGSVAAKTAKALGARGTVKNGASPSLPAMGYVAP